MSSVSFGIKFESVMGSYDRVPPKKPEIIQIIHVSPELIRNNGGFEVK